MSNLILASLSPRRKELLARLTPDFTVLRADCDEWYPPALTGEKIVEYISGEKASAAAQNVAPEDVVIAADTMVFLDGVPLGKPADETQAAAMLRALSGRTHTVFTGVSVRRGNRALTQSEGTRVRFAPLTDEMIAAYIATGEPMDKAGAYGIQARGALLVEGIEGDYFNVMGLPLRRLGLMLQNFGIDLFGRSAVRE